MFQEKVANRFLPAASIRGEMGSVNNGPQPVQPTRTRRRPSLRVPGGRACPALPAGATLSAKPRSRATQTYCPSLPPSAVAQRCDISGPRSCSQPCYHQHSLVFCYATLVMKIIAILEEELRLPKVTATHVYLFNHV